MHTRPSLEPGCGLPITCVTSTKNTLARDLTTVPPKAYSTNENRCPKQHNPTVHLKTRKKLSSFYGPFL